MKFQRNVFRTFFRNLVMKQTFCLFHFFLNLLLEEKNSENALKHVLKLINYSCRSYPTRASYSGQVDGFSNPMKNELKTRPCLKPVFEIVSDTGLNLHIDKATKTRGDK